MFIKECQSFYEGKHLEMIQMYELIMIGEEIQIGDKIRVSELAMKQTSDSVSLDVRYFWFICQKLKEKNKGILMVHNHGNESKPSSRDEKSYQNVMKVIKFCGIDTLMFCIYSPSEFYYRIVGDLFEEKNIKLKRL